MAYTLKKGHQVYVLVDDTAVECLTQSDMSSTGSELDTTCKNLAGTTSSEVGALTTEVTIGGNYTDGTGSNEDFHTLWVSHRAKATVSITWGGTQTGDKKYTFDAKILSISAQAGNTGTLVTWTAQVKSVGDVTVATVS